MKIKKFNEILDPMGSWDPKHPDNNKQIQVDDEKYCFTKQELYDFIGDFVGAAGFSIEDVEDALKDFNKED